MWWDSVQKERGTLRKRSGSRTQAFYETALGFGFLPDATLCWVLNGAYDLLVLLLIVYGASKEGEMVFFCVNNTAL